MVYLDTSALAKLYYPEPESADVERWVAARGGPICWTALHDLELTNAFSLKLYREEITDSQYSAVLRSIDEDRAGGVLRATTFDHRLVWVEAVKLARAHTRTLGTRSLDVLHVAIACAVHCDAFLTNDERQLRIAMAANLDAHPVHE